MSDEKTAKIKKFSKEYIQKVLHKLDKSGRLPKRPPDSGASSTGAGTGDAAHADMTVEEAMDLSDEAPEHSEHEDDGDADVDVDVDGLAAQDEQTPVEPAESDTSTAVVSDPRRRARGSAGLGKEWMLESGAAEGDVLMRETERRVGSLDVGS